MIAPNAGRPEPLKKLATQDAGESDYRRGGGPGESAEQSSVRNVGVRSSVSQQERQARLDRGTSTWMPTSRWWG